MFYICSSHYLLNLVLTYFYIILVLCLMPVSVQLASKVQLVYFWQYYYVSFTCHFVHNLFKCLNVLYSLSVPRLLSNMFCQLMPLSFSFILSMLLSFNFLDFKCSGSFIICLVCFNKGNAGKWSEISDTSMEDSKFFCSPVEIYMLSIKVTLDCVILVGLVITGSKLWPKLLPRNC